MNEETDKRRKQAQEWTQALEWALRIEDATPEERAAFRVWARQSPRHMPAFVDAVAFLARLGRPIDAEALAKLRQIESDDVHRRGKRSAAVPDSRVPRWKIWSRTNAARNVIRAAAALILALGATLSLFVLQSTSGREIETRAGEWQTKELPDGTIVRAGPRTRLLIEFTESRRDVRLVYGQALFHVAKDADRPFIVTTESGTARAVGTAFTVTLYETSRLKVAVKEGIVEVARPYSGTQRASSNAPGQSVILKAGEQTEVTSEDPLTSKPVDLEAALAWASGRLIFKHETIEQAVREFNYRNELQIKVLDPKLLQRPIRGTFAANDPQSFAALLEAQGALTVNEDSGTLLIAPYPDADATE